MFSLSGAPSLPGQSAKEEDEGGGGGGGLSSLAGMPGLGGTGSKMEGSVDFAASMSNDLDAVLGGMLDSKPKKAKKKSKDKKKKKKSSKKSKSKSSGKQQFSPEISADMGSDGFGSPVGADARAEPFSPQFDSTIPEKTGGGTLGDSFDFNASKSNKPIGRVDGSNLDDLFKDDPPAATEGGMGQTTDNPNLGFGGGDTLDIMGGGGRRRGGRRGGARASAAAGGEDDILGSLLGGPSKQAAASMPAGPSKGGLDDLFAPKAQQPSGLDEMFGGPAQQKPKPTGGLDEMFGGGAHDKRQQSGGLDDMFCGGQSKPQQSGGLDDMFGGGRSKFGITKSMGLEPPPPPSLGNTIQSLEDIEIPARKQDISPTLPIALMGSALNSNDSDTSPGFLKVGAPSAPAPPPPALSPPAPTAAHGTSNIQGDDSLSDFDLDEMLPDEESPKNVPKQAAGVQSLEGSAFGVSDQPQPEQLKPQEEAKKKTGGSALSFLDDLGSDSEKEEQQQQRTNEVDKAEPLSSANKGENDDQTPNLGFVPSSLGGGRRQRRNLSPKTTKPKTTKNKSKKERVASSLDAILNLGDKPKSEVSDPFSSTTPANHKSTFQLSSSSDSEDFSFLDKAKKKPARKQPSSKTSKKPLEKVKEDKENEERSSESSAIGGILKQPEELKVPERPERPSTGSSGRVSPVVNQRIHSLSGEQTHGSPTYGSPTTGAVRTRQMSSPDGQPPKQFFAEGSTPASSTKGKTNASISYTLPAEDQNSSHPSPVVPSTPDKLEGKQLPSPSGLTGTPPKVPITNPMSPVEAYRSQQTSPDAGSAHSSPQQQFVSPLQSPAKPAPTTLDSTIALEQDSTTLPIQEDFPTIDPKAQEDLALKRQISQEISEGSYRAESPESEHDLKGLASAASVASSTQRVPVFRKEGSVQDNLYMSGSSLDGDGSPGQAYLENRKYFDLPIDNKRIAELEEELAKYRERCFELERELAEKNAKLKNMDQKFSEDLHQEHMRSVENITHHTNLHKQEIDSLEAQHREAIATLKKVHLEELAAVKKRTEDAKILDQLASQVETSAGSLKLLHHQLIDQQHSVEIGREAQLEARERLLGELEGNARKTQQGAELEIHRLQGLFSSMESVMTGLRGHHWQERERLKNEHARLEGLQAAFAAEAEQSRLQMEEDRKVLRARLAQLAEDRRRAENELDRRREEVEEAALKLQQDRESFGRIQVAATKAAEQAAKRQKETKEGIEMARRDLEQEVAFLEERLAAARSELMAADSVRQELHHEKMRLAEERDMLEQMAADLEQTSNYISRRAEEVEFKGQEAEALFQEGMSLIHQSQDVQRKIQQEGERISVLHRTQEMAQLDLIQEKNNIMKEVALLRKKEAEASKQIQSQLHGSGAAAAVYNQMTAKMMLPLPPQTAGSPSKVPQIPLLQDVLQRVKVVSAKVRQQYPEQQSRTTTERPSHKEPFHGAQRQCLQDFVPHSQSNTTRKLLKAFVSEEADSKRYIQNQQKFIEQLKWSNDKRQQQNSSATMNSGITSNQINEVPGLEIKIFDESVRNTNEVNDIMKTSFGSTDALQSSTNSLEYSLESDNDQTAFLSSMYMKYNIKI